MKLNEQVGYVGNVHYVHRDSEGNVLNEFDCANTTTNAGFAEVAELIIGAGTAMSNIAIGTGSSNFAATSTELNDEYKRDTATTSTATTTATGDTSQLIVTFSFTESKAIVESGVLNASTNGDMVCAQTFSAVNVANGDSLQVTWKIAVA